MFIGEYNVKVDAKGRIILPVKFREQLENVPIILSRGLDNCITLHLKENYEKKLESLDNQYANDSDQRRFTRILTSGASEPEFDSQGRLNIPQPLINFSNIQKDAVVIGNGKQIEIWSKENWENYLKEGLEIFNEIGEKINL